MGALSLELKAQQQAGHWDEVLDIVQQLEVRQAIDMTVAAQLRQQAYLESLRAQQSAVALAELVQRIPAEYLRRTKVAVTAARALLKFADYALAQKVIANSLDVQWDSELVSLYGDNLSSDLSEPIAHAENWLVHHPKDVGLLLALGKLCMHQQLWAKAQSYLERSISVSPSYAAYTALALLSKRLGKSEQTYHYHQLALALRDPAAASGSVSVCSSAIKGRAACQRCLLPGGCCVVKISTRSAERMHRRKVWAWQPAATDPVAIPRLTHRTVSRGSGLRYPATELKNR